MQNNIFLDIDFLHAVWGSVLGFIYQNIITLMTCIFILAMGKMSTLLEWSLSRIDGIIYVSGVFCLFGGIAFVLRLLFFRPNPYNVLITPVSSLKQIIDDTDEYQLQDNQNAKFLLPGVTILTWLFFFLYLYFFNGNIQKAFLDAVLIVMPFHLGFIAFHVIGIVLEMLLLFSRYVVQSR